MSPQFVDFDQDGQLDIVAGTFDGSPHVAYGTPQGWKQPEQILDKEGQRIVANAWWNFDAKKWDDTDRCNPEGHELAEGHITSAWAADMDGDGDLDLLLGDHRSGYVYLRRNEGSPQQLAFATRNEVLLAAGAVLKVPGTVTTLRLFDWNRDGAQDLLLGSMGDAYSAGAGGGIFLFPNEGTNSAPSYGEPQTLVKVSGKGGSEPTRPDSGLYMDVGDLDGDGDFDLVVGGYSHWTPAARELSADEQKRVEELQKQLAELDAEQEKFWERVSAAMEGLSEEAAEKKQQEMFEAEQKQLQASGQKRQKIQEQIDALVPSQQRVSYVWLYENLGAR
ncbi:MAG: VCBS repeat-containing protein [Planctomycetes bacterium]|nr:VCBS repeat-containing protein [Planctomycetota bacterium]